MKVRLTNWPSVRKGPPFVGTAGVYTIMAKPRHWEHGMGMVTAFVPPLALLDAFRSVGDFDEYANALVKAWEGRAPIAPGQLADASRNVIADDATLCCSCGVGKPCHRWVAAKMLLDAGWDVVLDGAELPKNWMWPAQVGGRVTS